MLLELLLVGVLGALLGALAMTVLISYQLSSGQRTFRRWKRHQ